jgi:hypothetical protein
MPAFRNWGISWEYSSQLLFVLDVNQKANIEAKKKPAVKGSQAFL